MCEVRKELVRVLIRLEDHLVLIYLIFPMLSKLTD